MQQDEWQIRLAKSPKSILIMISIKNFCLSLGLATAFTACQQSTGVAPTPTPTPTPTPPSTSAIVDANTNFAVNLYRELVDETENQVFSPYSVSKALGMVYAGSDGVTATELQQVFGYGPNISGTHTAMNQLSNILSTNIGNNTSSQFNVLNKIWKESNLPLLLDYEAIMSNDYQAPIVNANFNQHQLVRKDINDWVDQETNQMIPELIPDGFIKPTTRLILVNALYFSADWAVPFPQWGTSPSQFTTSTGNAVTVDQMRELIPTADLKFTEDAQAEVLELSFEDQTASMVLILPKDAQLGLNSFVQQHFTKTQVDQWLNDLATPAVNSNFSVGLPKWDFDSDFDLKDVIATLGAPSLFYESCDLSKMSNAASLLVEEIKHKAAIKTHESGVEAAAATAVSIGVTSVPPVERTVFFDRPFIFLIKENETNSLLFVGHVQNPS